MKLIRCFLIAVIQFYLSTCLAQAGSLAPDLKARLERVSPSERLRVIVRMDKEADISVFPRGQREVMVKYLQNFAAASQRDLLASLPRYGDKVSRVSRFWIYNGISLVATKDVILDLVLRPDVGSIEESKTISLEPLTAEDAPAITGVEWNISRIQADRVWRELGYTGQGIVIGNIDSGVMATHETFGGRWRGGNNSWFDAVNDSTHPYDDYGHGTWTMGIACGGSTADSIGVAPGARFVAAKAIDSNGIFTYEWMDSCFQWYASLGAEAPHVINNSYGWGVGGTFFWQQTRNLQIMGIHQVCANGNLGPNPGTVTSPAGYPHLFGVGASTFEDTVPTRSSRGPSPQFGAMESTVNYLDTNWALSRRKPDLVAPGLYIRSSDTTGGYSVGSGTSASAPHVAGVIALMLQKNPDLTDKQIWKILTSTCDTFSWGGPYPNQNYGWGRLNAYRAVLATPPSGVSEEAAQSPVSRLLFSVFPNPFVSFTAIPGHASERFALYDITGRKVGMYKGDRVGEGLSAGVYFLRPEGKNAKPLRIVKVR